MKRFLIPVAGLAGALVVAVAVFVAGGLTATNALASGAFLNGSGGPWMGPQSGPWGGGDPGAWVAQLPPELKGLGDIPAADRFNHIKGVTINLTDKNAQPLTVTATPGTVTSVSVTSLTLAANDGSTTTYTLDDKTIEKGKTAPAANEKVAVVTVNGSSTATAVLAAPSEGFGPHSR